MEARNLVPFGAWGQDSTRYPSISSLLDVMEPYMRRIQLRTSSMVLAVSIAFGVCLVLILLMLWYHGKTKIPRVAVTSPLEALLAFVTPTRSHWPSHYINVAQDASSSDSKIISLSLSSLVNDVIAGNMELRNAKDLSDLFLDSLGKGTFRIRLHIEWSWWFRVGLRSFTQRLTVCKRKVRFPESRSVILNGSEFKLELKTCFATLCSGTCLSSAAMSTLLTKDQLPSVATDAIPTHTLDMVSRSNLRAFLRNLQSTTSPGGSVLLAFSTLSAPLSFSSAAYILVAIPFLPHNPVKKEITSSLNNHSHRPLSERRTLLPVQTSLDQIIRELTSGPAAFNIEFVHDASVVHAIDLNKRIQELETDIYSRKAFIAKWGLGTWREERFLIAWETALIAAGLLTRWVVLVRR